MTVCVCEQGGQKPDAAPSMRGVHLTRALTPPTPTTHPHQITAAHPDAAFTPARVAGLRRTPLHAAVEAGSSSVVAAVCDALDAATPGAGRTATAQPGLVALAALHGTRAHVAVLMELLRRGADVVTPNARGDGPLHAAARGGRAAPLAALLAARVVLPGRAAPVRLADVAVGPGTPPERYVDQRSSKHGLTPLELAVLSGAPAAVASLLAAGADACCLLPRRAASSARVAPGSTALHVAAAHGTAAAAAVLLDYSSHRALDLRAVRDSFGRTAARVAAAAGHAALARALAPPRRSASSSAARALGASPSSSGTLTPGDDDDGGASTVARGATLAALAGRARLLLALDRAAGTLSPDAASTHPARTSTADEADLDAVLALVAAANAAAASAAGGGAPGASLRGLVASLATVAAGAAKATALAPPPAAASASPPAPTPAAAALARAAAAAVAAACPATSAPSAPVPPRLGATDPHKAASYCAAVARTLAASPAEVLSATAIVMAGPVARPRRRRAARRADVPQPAVEAAPPPPPPPPPSPPVDRDSCCPICLEAAATLAIDGCGHALCLACVTQLAARGVGAVACPLCRRPVASVSVV